MNFTALEHKEDGTSEGNDCTLDVDGDTKSDVEYKNLSDINNISFSIDDYPNARFYYKIVAKIGVKFYSIFDFKTEYEIGNILYQKAEPKHKVILIKV